MTYSVEMYLTGTECGTVLDVSSLDAAHAAVSDFAAGLPAQSSDWAWNIWHDSELIASGPEA